jgi:NAD(P)-dependent dehydrogenase (short-subunit alcohol dehydrogenase family)
VHALTRSTEPVATLALFNLMGGGPKAVEDFAVDLFGSNASFVTTNVIGRQEPLYLAGDPPGMATIAYNTCKGADINPTRALAADWGRYNINVNAICPGFFPSKMSAGLLRNIEKMVVAATPLHRLGGEEDLMGAVVFLASEASRHVTGQYLAVDGGMSIC